MIQQPFPMAPGATTNFYIDWADWLEVGDSVSGASVVSGDADVTIVGGSQSVTGTVLTFKATLDPTARLNRTLTLAKASCTTTRGLVDPRIIVVSVQAK